MKVSRKVVFSSIASLIFSSFLVIGAEINNNSKTDWSFLSFIKFAVIFAIIFFIFYKLLDKKIKLKSDEIKLKRWQLFLILIIPSLFLLWATNPGIFSWDSGVMYHYYATGEYTTHFSLIISWLLGSCVSLGQNIFGSANFGLVIFLLIQILAANFALTEVITYCSKKLKSKPFLIVCIIYFVTHLLVQNMLITAHQDVLFGSFAVLLALEFLKMVEDETYFSKKSNWLKVGIFTFFMCAVRNNGFFALLPTIVIGTIFLKGKRKNFFLILLIPMLLFQGYQKLVVNKIVVRTEPIIRESMNVPILQIARTLYYTKDTSFDERLYPFFGDCNWDLYEYSFDLSDDFKECMNNRHMGTHMREFIALWAEIGMKYPQHYFDAPFALTRSLYYPWVTYNHDDTTHRYHSFAHHSMSESVMTNWEDSIVDIKKAPNLPWLDSALDKYLSNQYWSETYGVRLIWCAAFTTYLLIITIIFALYRKLYKYIVPLGLLFGILLTVALAPTVQFRYVFPVVIAFPIMLYILIKCVSAKR